MVCSYEVSDIAKNLRQRRTGSVHYSSNQIRALKALTFWLNEQVQTGAALDGTQWTIDKREEIEDRMRVEDDQPATKSNLSDVKKFASIEHDACVASLRTYLAAETNISDLFTKVHDGNRRNALCSCIFY